MRLRHIEVVNAIRITGTLKATAELLSLTQPAITQILQSAERQLGYALFNRVRGKLIPTQEAQRLFPEILRLDEQLQAVQRLAENLREGTSDSSIRVLAAPALAQTIVAEAAVLFAQKYPGTRLSIRADYSETAVSNIALLEADVGVLYHSVSHPAIKETKLGASRLVCVGHPSVLPSLTTVDFEFLESREIVGPDPADPLGRLLAERLKEISVTVKSVITAQSYHSLIALAANSGLLTIVDEISALTAKSMGLRVVPLSPKVAIPVAACVAINGERSVPVQRFIETCHEVLASTLSKSAVHEVG
jgi:DNA-binding transcriptional LysR family regulator